MTSGETDTTTPNRRWMVTKLGQYPSPALPARSTSWMARLRAVVAIPVIEVFFAIVTAALVATVGFGLFLLAQQIFLS